MDWTEFFNMGGYAFHVWSSWGISTGVLITIVIIAKRRNAKIKQDIKRQIRREAQFDEKA